MSDLESKLHSQHAVSQGSSKLRHEIDDLTTRLQSAQETASKHQEANKSLRQEMTKQKAETEQLKERQRAALDEKGSLEQQLHKARAESEAEKKARQALEKTNQELVRLSREQEDEVSSLMGKLSETNSEAQRAKRMSTQVSGLGQRVIITSVCLGLQRPTGMDLTSLPPSIPSWRKTRSM